MPFQVDKEKITLFIIILVLLILIFQIALAIKPFALFKEARNTTRKNHLELIANVLYFYFTKYHKFPDCIPEKGAVSIEKCLELKEYLTHFPKDPNPKYKYLIEYFDEEKTKIRVFSNSPEAQGIEIVR